MPQKISSPPDRDRVTLAELQKRSRRLMDEAVRIAMELDEIDEQVRRLLAKPARATNGGARHTQPRRTRR